MPNHIGGKNYKKGKHGGGMEAHTFVEREVGQMYGRILKPVGCNTMSVYCNDNIVRLCHIPGSMRKRVWMSSGDIVIISLRDFEQFKVDKTEKGDILYKYAAEDYNKLKNIKDINPHLLSQSDTTKPVVEDGYDFDYENTVEEDGTVTKTLKKDKESKHVVSKPDDFLDIDAI